MLARTIEPAREVDAAALATGARGDVRVDAFGRAQRHSNRVRVLKLALPLLAAAIAVAFPVYSYLAAPASVTMQADGGAFSDGKLVMANPKLDGFTKGNLPYSMTAIRAVQDVAKEGVIQLEGIDAKLPISADNVASVAASRGIYSRDGNTLNLNSEVTVSTTDGMVATLKSAYLNMAKGTMKTDKPVDISRDGSRITSDSMRVQDHGKVLIFEKRVRVNIDPARMKAAKQKSGESNATQ